MVHQLFIDQDDIINKASLVDPAQFHGLQWLKGNNYKQSFMRYKPKSKSNNNNNNNKNNSFAMRPKLTNDTSGDSNASAATTKSASSIGSLGSLRSFDTDNTYNASQLQLNHSVSNQTMISQTPAFANNDSNTSSNNNGNNNNGTETVMVGQLRQQLNDALTMAASVMRDSQLKDQLINQQEQQIKHLQQQIEQQKQLLTTTLPKITPSMPYVPLPLPTLTNNNSNVSNASTNNSNNDNGNGNNTPSPIGLNNMVSTGNNMNNMGYNPLFPVQNNWNVLSVANQFNVPTTSIPAFVPNNSFTLINNTPPASICNAATLNLPNYSIHPKSGSNSPQMPFPNNTQF